MADLRETVRTLYRKIDAHEFDDAVALPAPSCKVMMSGMPEPTSREGYRAFGEAFTAGGARRPAPPRAFPGRRRRRVR
ncbi:MAG: hypothetical protein GEU71_17445 [Actinobacteria bacterium]|nr:hypothetical protein [Actinomycetota bacterium]